MNLQTRRGRGPGRSETARSAILAAAARQFIERGFEKLTIEGVAAEAGVGKQTIYRWWGSKAALVADCLGAGLLIPDWFAPADSGDIREDLGQWLRNVVAFVSEPGHDALLRSLVIAAAEDDTVALTLSTRIGIFELLGGRLERAVEGGDIGELPVQALVQSLLGAVVVQALLRQPFDDAFVSRVIAALLPARS